MGKRVRRKSTKTEAAVHEGTAETGATSPTGRAAAPAEKEAARPTAVDTDDSGDEANVPGKRRKRTRRRKKAGPQAGPDPATFPDLDEAAQKSIAYARTYVTDRSAWKFSKPRQNWLMRHVLWSKAIHGIASQLGATPASVMDSAVSAEDRTDMPPAVQVPDDGSWIPDEYASVVAAYLQSMMGMAKQRMLETLEATAAKQLGDAPPAAPTPPAELAVLAGAAPADGEDRANEGVGQEENAQEEDKGLTADALRELAASWFSMRRDRADTVLQQICAVEAK
ncbi:hypothetical protein MSPP1_001938 [Malassezia sp. CBS 17886]|nr:hypothetical protein MSPP1_001938 [Malassezia sp. CBS 17886]